MILITFVITDNNNNLNGGLPCLSRPGLRLCFLLVSVLLGLRGSLLCFLLGSVGISLRPCFKSGRRLFCLDVIGTSDSVSLMVGGTGLCNRQAVKRGGSKDIVAL